jgi:hypothetical protein
VVDGADAADDMGAPDDAGADGVDEVDEVEVAVFYAGDSADDDSDSGHGISYKDACDNTYGDDENNRCQILLSFLQKMQTRYKTRAL